MDVQGCGGPFSRFVTLGVDLACRRSATGSFGTADGGSARIALIGATNFIQDVA